MKGLIIKRPWIDFILDGVKAWEVRGSNTNVRGEIALIESGTKTVVGVAELVGSRRLSLEEYQASEAVHCIRSHGELPYPQTFGWVLENPRRLSQPVPYAHPQGAVIWVNLDPCGLECYRENDSIRSRDRKEYRIDGS